MPATSRQTRKQIRQAIGLRTGSVWVDGGDAASSPTEESPTAAKIIDNALAFGTDDEHRGKWVWATDSGSSAELRRAINSSPDERSITVSEAFSAALTSSAEYELWDSDFSPTISHSLINQAIDEVTRKGAVHAEADSFHTGGNNNAFAVDSAWLGVKEVSYRESVLSKSLATMDEAADSLTANTAVELDSADYREGAGSLKLTVAAGESSGTAIANSSFSAIDIRGYDQIEFWFKTSGAITSSNYVVQLMQTSSAQVEISLPASDGDKWTYHKASITAPENNSGITAVQVSTGSSDGGAAVVWLDDVKVTRDKSGVFKPVPRDFWTLSQADREVRIDGFNPGYRMLKITGVRKPNALNSDSDVCEIDAAFIINSVIGKRLFMKADNNAGRRDAAGLNAGTFLQLAELIRNRWSMPSNVRWLDD